MSLSNKYLNNTILGRYHDDTPDATLSKVASNLMVTQEQQGYQIINTKDFPQNTVPESKYACYDCTYSFGKYLIFHDIFFQLAFEKYDSQKKTYVGIVRHFLLKVDASIWVKQIRYYYPRSISTLSDANRQKFTKALLQLPAYDDFNTYYSSVYALKTKSPSLPFPCDIGIGSGCFKSELDFFLQKYNNESDFGSLNDAVIKDRQDTINAFYLLTGEDLTSIGYNSLSGSASNSYIYQNSLMNKPYATGAGPLQQGPYLDYIADNSLIASNEKVVDTDILSPDDPLREPPSTTQPQVPPLTGTPSQPIVMSPYGSESNYIHDGYSTTVTQYGTNPQIQGDPSDYGIMDVDDYLKQKCEQMSCCVSCSHGGQCNKDAIY